MASRTSPDNPDELTRALLPLARLLVPLIAEELGAQKSQIDRFTSIDLPPELRQLKDGRRRFREIVKRSGRGAKDGHVWVIGAREWYEIRRAKRPVSELVRLQKNPPNDDDDDALESAGLRPTANGAA